jgi:glutamine synthetase
MDILKKFLAAHTDINFIRFEWLDIFGILRTRVLTKSHAVQSEDTGRKIAVQPASLWLTYVGVPDRAPPPAVSTLHPDWNSIQLYSCYPGHASVMCYVHEGLDNMGYRRCPRSILTKCVQRAESDQKLQLLVGFEIEFVLIDPSIDEFLPVKNVPAWSSAAGLRNKYHAIIEDIVLGLQSSGIDIEQYHTEGAQGMFEIVLGPASPVKSVDSMLRAKETIKAICTQREMKATMFPKPTERPGLVGQHIHLSISPCDAEGSFLAGILGNLPAICALSMPNHDSYSRVLDFGGTVGTWVGWGEQLRDVPIRKIEGGHWEFRPADGTANMYLTLAGIIGSGLLGIEEAQVLMWKDAQVAPARLDHEARIRCGIERQLPASLSAAFDELERSQSMARILGECLVTKYLEVKREEGILLLQMTEKDRRTLALDFF